jgi:hypothetical protein
MTTQLPQLYRDAARSLIAYASNTSEQIAMITIDPALPCFICSQPATKALITPAQEHLPNAAMAWLTFPICDGCEKRQIITQAGGSNV